MAGQKISIIECYKILQVPQNASMAEVKQAYRKRAFELHPDLNPNSPSANQNFQNLNEAYVIIIEHIDAKEKTTQSTQNTKQETNSQKAWSQRSWGQKSKEEEQKEQEERAKREEERRKREEERQERLAREREAAERFRAKERAARENAERIRLREKIAQEDAKRKEQQKIRNEQRAKQADEFEERERARVLWQMEEEARRNREAAERKTRAYSNLGKPIFDQDKYKSSSKESAFHSDFFTHSSSQTTEETQKKPFENDEALREKILKELLEDDYARKVYEDIYNELHARKSKEHTDNEQQGEQKIEEKTIINPFKEEKKQETLKKTVTAEYVRPTPKKAPLTQKITQQVGKKIQQAGQNMLGQNITEKFANNIKQGVSGWLKNQIDDELELFLPASRLIAGAKMRLQIRTGWMMGESHTVELTLPADFVPGKPFRLKGMGKKIGKWQGDLYLKLQVKQGK